MKRIILKFIFILLVEEKADIKLSKVNCEDEFDVCRSFQLTKYPQIRIFRYIYIFFFHDLKMSRFVIL